jgi:hypothetical protein
MEAGKFEDKFCLEEWKTTAGRVLALLDLHAIFAGRGQNRESRRDHRL